MAGKFIVSASPHYRSNRNIRSIMFDIILALLPILIIGIIMYGWRVLSMTIVSVGSCIAFESSYNLIRKKKNSVWDLSCVVTGMMLSFILPVTTSYIIIIAGAFFAIVIVKMLFGGIGKNFLNPALAARAFIYTFASLIYIAPFNTQKISVFFDSIFNNNDSFYVPSTPLLQSLKEGVPLSDSIFSIFIGNVSGNIGETCILLIIICGLFLLWRKVITWHIPVSFLLTVFLITLILPHNGNFFDIKYTFMQICSGGLVFAAFFMATDYSTCPVTNKGRIIHGILCGVLTVIFRYFGSVGDGVTYAILIMNVFAQSLDVITKPSRYGKGGIIHEAKEHAE